MTAADWNTAIRACIRIANYRAIKHRDFAAAAVGDAQRNLARAAEQASIDIAEELQRQIKRERNK